MLAPLLLALCAFGQDADKTPSLTLAPPARAVSAGAVVPVGVFFRNLTAEPLPFMPPGQLDAEIVTQQSRSAVVMARTGEWSERTIAPGESLYVEYALDLPDEVTGRVVLQLVNHPAAPAVIDVEKPPEETTGGVEAPATTTKVEPDVEGPLDPESAPLAPAKFQFADAALQRFHPYEPMYAVIGTDQPNARFQFSFQYQILNPEGPWVSHLPFLSGLYLGYTQTGLWDLEGESKPFTDTNYRPEIAWSTDELSWLSLPGVKQTGLQMGIQHESNGRDGLDSRSVNLAYLRPVFHFGDSEGLHWQFAPKVYAYLPDREDNPDISDYRGYCDLGLTVGWKEGFQAAAIGRIGSSGEYGSIQIDLSYPLRAMGDGNFDLFLQVQWFSGYGESLITYDQYTDALRIGVGLVR